MSCLREYETEMHLSLFRSNLFLEHQSDSKSTFDCTRHFQPDVHHIYQVIYPSIIHMNLAVKFNLLKNTQSHYSYTPESCLENDNYKLYFDRTVLTDNHIKHNRPDITVFFLLFSFCQLCFTILN
jgi:predicted transcriptional regulator